ncbi:MAG: hypothetical protein ACXVGR_14980, partial [Mycobacteriaceae bacterium]
MTARDGAGTTMLLMGSGHSHRAGPSDVPDLEVARVPRTVLVAALVLAAVATVVGLVSLWPDAGKVDKVASSVAFAAPGVTFPHAAVTRVEPACRLSSTGAATHDDHACGQLEVTVSSGQGRGERARVQVAPQV